MSKKNKSNGSNQTSAATTVAATETHEAANTSSATTAVATPPVQATAPVVAPTPTPPVMAATVNGTTPAAPLPIIVQNGRVALDQMMPDEAAEFERIRLQQEQFAAQVKARKERQIAELHERFTQLPSMFGCDSQDSFTQLYSSFINGTLGQDNPAPAKRNGGTRGQRISEEIRNKVEKDLKNGIAAPKIAADYGVSLPWVNGFKSKLGLTKARKKK